MSADDAQALGNLASGVAALTGADVRTLQSVQLKGAIVAVEPASAEDLEHVAVHTDAFFRIVEETDGLPLSLLRRLMPHELIAFELVVDGTFDQSPGPTRRLGRDPGIVMTHDGSLDLDAIDRCFAGAIPAVLATASADGVPNITYISKAHRVDDERIALSNQFMSKTARNLAGNPRASLLLIDPTTHDEFCLSLVYERTERRGHVFERLRHDVDVIAEMQGMQDVFRLRAATIFRVVDVEQVEPNASGTLPDRASAGIGAGGRADSARRAGRADRTMLRSGRPHRHHARRARPAARLPARAPDAARRGGPSPLHHRQPWFDDDSVGAEVLVGEGPIGVAAARCEPVRIGNLRQMAKYSRSIRQQFVDAGGVRPGRELRMPGLAAATAGSSCR